MVRLIRSNDEVSMKSRIITVLLLNFFFCGSAFAHNYLIECQKEGKSLVGVVTLPKNQPQMLFGNTVYIERKDRMIIGSSANKQFLINMRTGEFSPEQGRIDPAVKCKVTNMRHTSH